MFRNGVLEFQFFECVLDGFVRVWGQKWQRGKEKKKNVREKILLSWKILPK